MAAVATAALAVLPSSIPPTDRAAGGDHWRLETTRGPVHVWRPDGYDPATAGTVLYVHGYYTSVDETWATDQLAEQFARGGRNALFVVPEAPSGADDEVRWDRVEDLVRVALAGTGLPRPPGPLVTIAHSGAYRTLLPWLSSSALDQVVLLDALYGDIRPFRDWLSAAQRRPVNRMIIIAVETAGNAELLLRSFRGGARRDAIPDSETDVDSRERQARLIYFKSQYTHEELVTDGKVLSLVLRLSPLKRLAN
jgi:hypothetical protein